MGRPKGIPSHRKGKIFVKRIISKCKYCKNNFEQRITENKIFCSQECCNKSKIGKKRPAHSKLLKEKHKEKIFGFKKNDLVGNKNYAKRPEVRKKIRLAKIKRMEMQFNQKLPTQPMIGKNEKQILDSLEKYFGYKIIRQFSIIGYFLDGYIPELNLVIEVDEKHHINKIEKDKERENNIINELNCKFLRIKDYE